MDVEISLHVLAVVRLHDDPLAMTTTYKLEHAK